MTGSFCCFSCFVFLLLSWSSFPAFLTFSPVALCPMGILSTCLCVLVSSQFPRRSDCTCKDILARGRQTNMRVSHLSPAAGNRQENLGRLLHKRRLLLERKHQISVPPCLRGQRSKLSTSH